MKKAICIFALLPMLVNLVSCEYFGIYCFENNSDDTIVVSFVEVYSDLVQNRTDSIGSVVIAPRVHFDASTMGSVYTRADMVSITYINKDTLDKYGWKEVIINKRIIMRYDISKDFYNNVLCDRDGYKMNLVYPPTESYLESDGFDIFEPSTQ